MFNISTAKVISMASLYIMKGVKDCLVRSSIQCHLDLFKFHFTTYPPLLSLPPKRGGEGRHLDMGPPRRGGDRRGIRGAILGARIDCAVTS